MNIFLKPEQFTAGVATLIESEHLHLTRVMRAKIGQELTLLDGLGNGFRAEIVEIAKHQTTAKILEPVALPAEPSIELSVAQALGKGDKFEQVIQHGTEIGASEFTPIRAERCVVDVPPAKIPDRVQRWGQIAKSAAEQSFRSRIPKVNAPAAFKAAIESAAKSDSHCLLLHTSKESIALVSALKRLDSPSKLTLLVGPEGGWSSGEIEFAQEFGVQTVSLGEYILRTETAALVAISQIIFHYDHLQPILAISKHISK